MTHLPIPVGLGRRIRWAQPWVYHRHEINHHFWLCLSQYTDPWFLVGTCTYQSGPCPLCDLDTWFRFGLACQTWFLDCILLFHTKAVYDCVILIPIHCDSSRHHTSSSPLKLVLCGFRRKLIEPLTRVNFVMNIYSPLRPEHNELDCLPY